MAQEDYVLINKQNQWIELTLNRPQNLNSLSEKMMQALQRALHDIAEQDDITLSLIHISEPTRPY